jgi:hypothetical protein
VARAGRRAGGGADALSARLTEGVQGDTRKGLSRFEESLEILSRLDNAKLANRARLRVCQMLVMLGEIDTAEPVVQEALAVASEQQDVHHALHLLGDCALIRGDVEPLPNDMSRVYGQRWRKATQ